MRVVIDGIESALHRVQSREVWDVTNFVLKFSDMSAMAAALIKGAGALANHKPLAAHPRTSRTRVRSQPSTRKGLRPQIPRSRKDMATSGLGNVERHLLNGLIEAQVRFLVLQVDVESALLDLDAQCSARVFEDVDLAMDSLDYSGPALNEGSKGLLVGVGDPWRELPRAFTGALPAGIREVAPYCAGCLSVAGPAYDEDSQYAETLARDPAIADWPLVVVVDDVSVAARNVSFLWTTFTRFEPAADIYAAQSRLHRHHECLTAPVVFDCRLKPGYPDELMADEETSNKVTRRWQEYFPKGDVEGDPQGHAEFRGLT